MAGLTIPEACKELFLPSRYKALHGGRGSAKSHSIAGTLIIKGANEPLRIGCYREIQKSIGTSVKQLLDDKIEAAGLRGFYRSTQYSIEGANGTKFLFGGLRTNPDSIKSTEGLDIAWVEEADRCSQASLDLLTPTLRNPQSEIWFSWNRRNATDPVDNMFLGGTPPPDSIILPLSWRDNPFFPEVLRREMEWLKGRDRDKWLHVWEGQLLQRSEAKVFKHWRIDDLDDQIPEGAIPRSGADWGFSIDPTCGIKIYRWGRTLYIAREVYEIGVDIDDLPSFFAGSDPRKPPRWENPKGYHGITDILDCAMVADSARPETISYLSKRGFNIFKAVKGARSIEEGVEFLQSLDIVVHPSCIHTINELDLYQYKVDPLTDKILSAYADKDNHVIDSIRYAVEAERRALKKRGGRIATVTELLET